MNYYRHMHPLELVRMEKNRRRTAQVVHAKASWTGEGVIWRADARGVPQPYDDKGSRFSWAPQPGSQVKFLASKAFETLSEGGRGTGKTDSLLMRFAQHTGKGYGQDWNGIIFRRTKPELVDIKGKALRWFPALFPGIVYNKTTSTWTWPTGETLRFAAARVPEDYNNFHGHAYAFMGWEELTNWPNDSLYTQMMSLVRSSNPDVPLMVCATTNPHGVGHGWVKERFRLPIVDGNYHEINLPEQKTRAAVHGSLEENRIFLAATPDYLTTLRATRDPMKRRAWMHGDWNIVSGGMFDDLWSERFHVLPPLRAEDIPEGWVITRAYDHGTSAPFSNGWYARSNGDPIIVKKKTWNADRAELVEYEMMVGQVKGDLVRFGEWYGWNGEANQGVRMGSRAIGKGILDRQKKRGIHERVRGGVADDSIWAGSTDDPSKSVASEMKAVGCEWEKAGKGPNSRTNGWQVMRDMMEGAIPDEEGHRDAPGLFVTSDCEHFLRTVPVVPRDGADPDDVDTESEDHVADEVSYACRAPKPPLSGRARMKALSR